jgi:hypothetical protein
LVLTQSASGGLGGNTSGALSGSAGMGGNASSALDVADKDAASLTAMVEARGRVGRRDRQRKSRGRRRRGCYIDGYLHHRFFGHRRSSRRGRRRGIQRRGGDSQRDRWQCFRER